MAIRAVVRQMVEPFRRRKLVQGFAGMVPGVVKAASAEGLEREMEAAAAAGFTAAGRPSWFRANRDSVRSVYVVPFGKQFTSSGVSGYRCMVAVCLDSGSVRFTLDVGEDRFSALPDCRDPYGLAKDLMGGLEFVFHEETERSDGGRDGAS